VRAEISIVSHYADSLGLSLSQSTLEQLDRYLHALLDWGGRINLVGSTTARSIVIDHFCDAVAAVAGSTIPVDAHVVDVGSGAGLPGIPVAIVRADLRVTLVEAIRKRSAFLEHARAEIDATWTVIWGRAELLARDPKHREQYDVALERAVAPIQKSVSLVLPFVSEGGLAVFMKGAKVVDEIVEIERAVEPLGGTIEATHSYTLPGGAKKVRTLVMVRKKRPGRQP
jgi:16S rRNA (guanine527-N7)-methyltransferase